MYTGRLQLKVQLQVRNLRKKHAHSYYCEKQRKNVKAWAFKFASFLLAIGGDDKATCNIGEPGTAVSVLPKQRKTVGSIHGNEIAAMDHEAGHVKVKMVPTVLLREVGTCAQRSRTVHRDRQLKAAVRAGGSWSGRLSEPVVSFAVPVRPPTAHRASGGGESRARAWKLWPTAVGLVSFCT